MPGTHVFCVCVDFRRKPGDQMGSENFRDALERLAKKADVRRRVHPHAFRHTAATEIFRESNDLYAVMRQLGHARPDVTDAYLRGLDPSEVLRPARHRHRSPARADSGRRARTAAEVSTSVAKPFWRTSRPTPRITGG